MARVPDHPPRDAAGTSEPGFDLLLDQSTCTGRLAAPLFIRPRPFSCPRPLRSKRGSLMGPLGRVDGRRRRRGRLTPTLAAARLWTRPVAPRTCPAPDQQRVRCRGQRVFSAPADPDHPAHRLTIRLALSRPAPTPCANPEPREAAVEGGCVVGEGGWAHQRAAGYGPTPRDSLPSLPSPLATRPRLPPRPRPSEATSSRRPTSGPGTGDRDATVRREVKRE